MTNTTARAPSKFWLYAPFVLFGVLWAAYTLYWFYARGQIETQVNAWIEDQRRAGVEITYAEKSLRGYPYRFALIIDEPVYAHQQGLEWRGEQLQLIMQPWNFQHIIGRAPGRTEVILPGGEPVTAILGRKSAASVSWQDSALNQVALSLDTADIVTSFGGFGFEDFTLNAAPLADDPQSVRLALDWAAIVLPDAPPGAGWLGNDVQTGTVRVELGDIMRAIVGESLAQGPHLDLAQLRVDWGPLKLGAKGEVSLIDYGCSLDGLVNFRLEETEPLRTALTNEGIMTTEIETGINAIGSVSERGGFAPVTIRDGAVTFLGQSVLDLPALCDPAEPAD